MPFSPSEIKMLKISDATEDSQSVKRAPLVEGIDYVMVPSPNPRVMQKLPICTGGIQSMDDEERNHWIAEGYIACL